MYMKLQDQVCLLEQAKKLKELGVAQDSLFRYCYYRDNSFGLEVNIGEDWITDDGIKHNWDSSKESFASAFSVAELLLMNNETITINYMQLIKPAEALADHLIGRITNSEITIDEVNQRLQQ